MLRPAIIKSLEKKQGESTGFGGDFLDMTPEPQATQGKIDK